MTYLLTSWGNPFKPSKSLTNLSGVTHVSDQVLHDLLQVEKIGRNQLQEFVAERIESNKKSFYAPIKQNKLQTFASLRISKDMNVNEKTVIVKSSYQLFSRFMMIQQSLYVSMRDTVEYELGTVPWALAKTNGEMWGTPKSEIIKDIEKEIPLTTSLPENTVRVFDAIVLIQKLPEGVNTFGDASDHILNRITKNTSLCVFLVSDQYDPASIISLEREARSHSGQIRTTPKRQEHKVPVNFEKFLNNSVNKLELKNFFVSDWSSTLHCAESIADMEIFVTLRNDGYKIIRRNNIPSCIEAPEICSDQEESDTKMFFCAAFALTLGFNSVCVISNDTDILILFCYFSNKLEGNLFIKLLTKPTRIFDFTQHLLDPSYCNALPGYHVVKGCDYTISFHGLGKTKRLKLLKDNLSFQVRVHCLYAK